MENFITGYPGHESEMRAAMLEALGKEKYEFFFDKVQQLIQLACLRSSSYKFKLLTCRSLSF